MNDSIKPQRFRFQGGRGTRLDKFLATQLAGASRTKIREWIAAGYVRLNRKLCRISSKVLLPGAEVELFLPRSAGNLPPHIIERQQNPTFDLQRIVFEDKDLVVVDKPAGLPAQPTRDPLRANLFTSLRYALAQRDRVAADHYYLTLQHRLDRDTSGLMLFTKTKRLNKAVTDAFRNHEAKKLYLAVVEGEPESAVGEYKNYMASTPNRRGAYSVAEKGGRFASTRWRRISTKQIGENKISLMVAVPATGRTHQIRVQFAHAGLPLLGDKMYGAQIAGAKRALLHALKLKIIGREFVAEPPQDFLELFPEIRQNVPQLLAEE